MSRRRNEYNRYSEDAYKGGDNGRYDDGYAGQDGSLYEDGYAGQDRGAYGGGYADTDGSQYEGGYAEQDREAYDGGYADTDEPAYDDRYGYSGDARRGVYDDDLDDAPVIRERRSSSRRADGRGRYSERAQRSSGARQKKSRRPKKRRSLFARVVGKVLLTVFLLLLVAGGYLGIRLYTSILKDAPDISKIDVTPSGYATFVYDDEGKQTAKLVAADSNRIPVTLDMVPKNLQHAFVAVEDARFYKHHGVDVVGIIRAGWKGITTGNFSQGASTITQQLIKNSVFTNFTEETKKQTVIRKLQEQYLAVQLERRMSKDDIMINYLNIINLGHNTLGVQAASQTYFGKPVSDLTLSECAVLAGITQNPSRYDPIINPEANKKRRKVVLDDMLDQNWITKAQYDEAMADDVYARISEHNSTSTASVNSYFVDALTDQLLADLVDVAGYTDTQAQILLYTGGLNIYSTQNQKIQKIADEEANNEANYPNGTRWYLNYQLSITNDDGSTSNYSTEMMLAWMKENGVGTSLLFSDQDAAKQVAEQYKQAMLAKGGKLEADKVTLTAQPQISLTIEDQKTGNVLAVVGGRGTKTASRTLNRATATLRQPGSTFKIVSTYAPALDAGGKTLATVYKDEPYNYSDGTPVRNWYGESYRGDTTIRTAIMNSMNIIAVKTLTDITPQLGYEYLQKFGFTTIVDKETIDGKVYSDIQQTMALGGLTKGVKNIELNAAYASIADGGKYIEPKLYTKVTDHDGNVILDVSQSRQERQVLKETTAWLLTSAMEDVVKSGTGTACQISGTPVAGKTGTTSNEHDVWFSGYSNYYTCTTWAGYDVDTDLVGSESGIAKKLWHAVMERVHEGMASSSFKMPSGITQATVCGVSGKLPVEGLCDAHLVTDYFAEGTVPVEYCNESYHADEIAAQKLAAATADAKAALDSANTTLTQAGEILSQAQNALSAAQASGDANAVAAAQSALDTANLNYTAAVQQQTAAEAAYNEALARAQAEAAAGTGSSAASEGQDGAEGTGTAGDGTAGGAGDGAAAQGSAGSADGSAGGAAASPAQGAGAQNGQLDSAGAAAQAVLQGIENQ